MTQYYGPDWNGEQFTEQDVAFLEGIRSDDIKVSVYLAGTRARVEITRRGRTESYGVREAIRKVRKWK